MTTAGRSVSLLLFALSVNAIAIAPGNTAEYAIDGFKLGDSVASSKLDSQLYICKPHSAFPDAVRCERTEQTKLAPTHPASHFELVRGVDGRIAYIKSALAVESPTKAAAEAEIAGLSKEFWEAPNSILRPHSNNDNTTKAIIAVWGSLLLEAATRAEDDVPAETILNRETGNEQGDNDGMHSYRITGGHGFIYIAVFKNNQLLDKTHIAIDASQFAKWRYINSIYPVLQADKALPLDDYSRWAEIAYATRQLARDTSPQTANSTLDQLFDKFHSTKLRSHVWSILPAGGIERLINGEFSNLDVYGPNTRYPHIRRELETFLTGKQNDAFIEFVYYTLGYFERALNLKRKIIDNDMLHYAIGNKYLQAILEDALKYVSEREGQEISKTVRNEIGTLRSEKPGSPHRWSSIMYLLNHHPEVLGHEPLNKVIPNFDVLAATARPHFDALVRKPDSIHADDAAYMMGWLLYHQQKTKESLNYFAKAMTIGNGDYAHGTLVRLVGMLEDLPNEEKLKLINTSKSFYTQPPLWYASARAAYRNFDYTSTIDLTRQALRKLNIPIGQLPATTDPDQIETALQKLSKEFVRDKNLSELVYILNASHEMLAYDAYLHSFGNYSLESFSKRVRSIIFKYSRINDAGVGRRKARVISHNDFRQAIHLIEKTLLVTPQDEMYSGLRQWLYYRNVRILAHYDPDRVPEAIAVMRKEFPASELLSSAMAEQIFAQGIVKKDIQSAMKTFSGLIQEFPNGNAVDNAYSWMEIIMRCAGRKQEAIGLNKDIVRQFPFTRHAAYARFRLSHPNRSIDYDNCGNNYTKYDE
jgi:tetratricopeptide (TPR) repeat protein